MDERTLARFLSKINKDGPLSARRPDLGPCWLWKPCGSVGGYGQFLLGGKMKLAHRVSHEHFTGPIPPKWTVDHLCCVRHCIRPDHLEAVTLAENLRRAREWGDYKGPSEYFRSLTHCAKGHEYTAVNTRITPQGRRSCRTCARELMAARRAKERAELPAKARKVKAVCVNGHSFTEFGVVRGGKRICGECARDRVRKSRAKKRAARGPGVPRLTCKNGHDWVDENIYVNPNTGQRACRPCHNERTLAEYYVRKGSAA